VFWRNYFYRVDLLKRAAGIDENKEKQEKSKGDEVCDSEPCDGVDQKDDQDDQEAIKAALISSIDVSLAHLSSSSSSLPPSRSLAPLETGEEEPDSNAEDTILIETGIDDLVSDDIDVEIADD